MNRLRPWIPFFSVCAALFLLSVSYALYHLGNRLPIPMPFLEEEPAPNSPDAYPPEQVETMRRYVDILREGERILAAGGTPVEERAEQLHALCPRMQALAHELHGMSDYRRDELKKILGCETSTLPHLYAELGRYIDTYGTEPAEGEDRRLMDATIRLLDSSHYGKSPCDVTPEETAQALLQHFEEMQAKLQRHDLSMVERLEALRLGYDRLLRLRAPLELGDDAHRTAYSGEVIAHLRKSPGAEVRLKGFLRFISPAPGAMLTVSSSTEMKMVEEQQSYERLLRTVLFDYLPGVTAG